MKREYAIKTLIRIKEIHANYFELKKLGVDLINYEQGVNLLEESICLMFADDEKEFEKMLGDVQWWLYENVDKFITSRDQKIDVRTAPAFIDWLISWYRKDSIK